MVNTVITTNKFKFDNVQDLINDVAGEGMFVNNSLLKDTYYFFVGDHVPHANNDVPVLSDNNDDDLYKPYFNMIMGKKISNSDVMPMVRNIPWSSEVFTMYDNKDASGSLQDQDFYTMVNEGAFYHVWKCLDNNLGNVSTITPSFAAGHSANLYQTSDGYRWKYMTSVDANTVSLFGTTTYFPIIANSIVTSAAVPGRIDIIAIQANQQGEMYNNYVDGTFKATDLLVNGDPTLLNISNNIVSTVNGFYTGCLLYLSGGAGQGQFKTIVDYVSNSVGNLIKLESPFITQPVNGTTFQVRPEVKVFGDGTQTQNCVARALVNSLTVNSVYRVEVLQFGAGYNKVYANVIANSVVGVPVNEIAIVRPILPPIGGHGSDIFNELYSHTLEFSVVLANSESNTIPTVNQYQQIGLLKNPLFQNVNISLGSTAGNFTKGETVYKITPVQLNVNCTANVGSSLVSCNNANFNNQVKQGDFVVVTDAGASIYELLQVQSVINTTTINCTSNSLFTCTNSKMYAANISSNCYTTSITNSSLITVTNATADLTGSSILIGSQSGARGTILSIARNGVNKFFDTFVELYKYDATLVSGSFQLNEVVNQGNSMGYVHHADVSGNNITLFISNMSVVFGANSTQVIGNTSGAVATLTKFYDREVIFGSGEIEYLENIEPVTRSNNQSENFQIFIEF